MTRILKIREFKVIVYSKVRFVYVLLFSLVVLPAPLPFLFRPFGLAGQISAIICIFVGLILFFILPKYVAKAVLIISGDTESLRLDWIKPFWGSKLKPSQHIDLDELKSYKYEPSNNFDTLKLRLKSGRKIKLHRWFFDSNDDFDKFMNYFRRTIVNHNNKKSTTTIIEREKLIMENRTFLITIAVIISLIFIGTILLLIFKGVSNVNTKGIVMLTVFLGPLVWVIIQVIKGLRETKV
jgi:hypothetical protein